MHPTTRPPPVSPAQLLGTAPFLEEPAAHPVMQHSQPLLGLMGQHWQVRSSWYPEADLNPAAPKPVPNNHPCAGFSHSASGNATNHSLGSARMVSRRKSESPQLPWGAQDVSHQQQLCK